MSSRFSFSLRAAVLCVALFSMRAGCSSKKIEEVPVQKNPPQATITPPSIGYEKLAPTSDAVGTIQVWRGSLLGPSETDVWLVSHTNPVPDGRPMIRGTFFERGSARRGNIVGQSILPNGFTFSFNWGPEEGDQGYGTSTHVVNAVNNVDTLQGEVRMGTSTRTFTLYPSWSLPSFALHRVATSTQEGDRETCSFSVEYPELLPPSMLSEVAYIPAAREAINTKIVQLMQSGTSTLELQAKTFLQDCTSQITDLKKENLDVLPESAFYTEVVEPDIAFANGQLASILFLNYSYTGGAHGNYGYDAHTFDLASGQEVLLQDLIRPSQLRTFYQRVSAKLLKNNREMLFPETVTEIENFLNDKKVTSTQSQIVQYGRLGNWYLTDDGIVFFYNPYELAPYAAGVQEVVLPFSEWKELAKPETRTRLMF